MLSPTPLPQLLQWLRQAWRLLLTLLFLVGGGSLVLGLIVLTAYRHGVFERQLHISVRVPDARGLRPGSRVILSGVQVGVLRWLEVQRDGQVLLQLSVPDRYRGVVSPASSLSISQDYLMGDQQLKLQPAPAPTATVPDRFAVRFRGGDSLEDLLGQLRRTLQHLDRLLVSGERLGTGDLPRTLLQLRGTLQRADALSGSLQRQLPETAAVLRDTGREAGRTAREARLASQELVRTLVQIRPELSRTLLQLDGAGEQAETVLVWLNALIDRLDPTAHLRRLGPQPRRGGVTPEAITPGSATP